MLNCKVLTQSPKRSFLFFATQMLLVGTLSLGVLSGCASPHRDTASDREDSDSGESCRETFPRGMNGPARIECN